MLRRLIFWFVLMAGALAGASPAAAGAAPPAVPVIEIRGAIGPAASAYFLRALDEAARRGAPLLVVEIDTPGGLDSSMREMIRALLASPVPVAFFVSPSGARAASAGTYLLYAAHVAAMAPGTNLGAATPVAIGIGGATPPGRGAPDKEEQPAAPAMERKAVHDAAAYLRSLAQMRGRNEAWAEKAVVASQSLSADEALAEKVIDLMARDVPELLRRLDGRRLGTAGAEAALALAGATTVAIERNWQERLLGVVSDPNVALLLMMLGFYGLLFEFYSPGLGVPGVVGGIALLLGLYGLALLPINYAGAALMALGVALMVAEAFVASFGVLGIGGVLAFAAGALMLVDAEVPGLQVSLAFVVPLAAASALVLAGLGALALRARRRPRVAGVEAMIGGRAEALADFAAEGPVRAFGETWQARSRRPLARGERARVVAVDGLTLILEPDDDAKGGTS